MTQRATTKLKKFNKNIKNFVTFDFEMDVRHLTKAEAKEFKSLSGKKNRDEKGLFLAEGEKCVFDLLPGFRLYKLVCSLRWWEANRLILSRYKGISEDSVLISDFRGLEIISTMQSVPEVIGVFHLPPQMEESPRIDASKWSVMLDEIQDPGNLGTIIRTCDWFGIYNIYASKGTADAYGPKVVKATMGSLSRVRVRYLDLLEIIESNPEIPVVGTLLEGENYNETKYPKGGILLMGNEGRGVSKELQEKMSISVTIPPSNSAAHPDSLNVAIATAIILSKIRS